MSWPCNDVVVGFACFIDQSPQLADFGSIGHGHIQQLPSTPRKPQVMPR
jgi:hypothetical protein